MNQQQEMANPEFNSGDLYLEESITDRQVGAIRRLSPITADGEPDSSRPVLYAGATQVMTAAGPMPLNFDIEAESLEEACGKFGACAQKAVEEMAQRLEEMRREQASQIVVPGQGGNNPGGSGLMGV